MNTGSSVNQGSQGWQDISVRKMLAAEPYDLSSGSTTHMSGRELIPERCTFVSGVDIRVITVF